MRPTVLALVLAMLAPAALRAQRLEPRLPEIAAEASPAAPWISSAADEGLAARAARRGPAGRGAMIGAGIGAAVGVVSFLAQDGTDNEFWPINLVVLVTGNTALGAAVGALVGWLAS